MVKKFLLCFWILAFVHCCNPEKVVDNTNYSSITKELYEGSNHIESKVNNYLIDNQELIKNKLMESWQIIDILGKKFENKNCDYHAINLDFEAAYISIAIIFENPTSKEYFQVVKKSVFLNKNDHDCVSKKTRMLIILANLRESLCIQFM